MSGTQCHAQMTNQMSFTVYSSRCLIREFQTGLREDPESMLYVLLVLMYHSFFSHLIGRMLCVTHACYPDQSLPIGLVYKLPLFLFLCCMPDEARDG